MKRIISVCISVLMLLGSGSTARATQTPSTGAEAFVLYCVENNRVVLSKHPDRRMKPASTTKLMTTLLTLEEAAKNNRTVTFTQEMIAEGSSMYLKVGEQVRLSDLAVGMMLCSGNDAANAAALAVGGSVKAFANRMNTRARQIGMTRTHFATPSGLDDPEHYTTAADLALLMAEGLRSKAFAELTFQKSASVRFVKPSGKCVTYSNHNRLLRMYKDCIGGKTGYTEAAGRCLVSAARRGHVTLICVTLNDRSDWDDHIALYEEGFSRLYGAQSGDSGVRLKVPCVGGEQDTLTVAGSRDAVFVVPRGSEQRIQRKVYLDPFLYAPVRAGETPGRIDYLLDGKRLDSVPLKAADSVAARIVKKTVFQRIKEFFTYG